MPREAVMPSASEPHSEVLRAGRAADEHLAGGFVFAVADQLDVHAEAVQQVFQIEHLQRDADNAAVAATARGHEYLVGRRAEIEAAVGGILEVGDHRFAALVEQLDGHAEFLQGRRRSIPAVGLEVEAAHSRVVSRGDDGVAGIPEADRLGAEHAAEKVRGRDIRRLLVHMEGGQVHDQNAVPGQRGLLLEGADDAPDQCGNDQECDEPHDGDAGDDGEKIADERFHGVGLCL